MKPANGNSYFQIFTVVKKALDPGKTSIQITVEGKNPVTVKNPLYQLIPMVAADFVLEGDVVFAGYGINAARYDYNDLDSLEIAGKIILIMDRAPLTPDGKKCLFEDQKWLTMNGLQNENSDDDVLKSKSNSYCGRP